MKSLEWMHKVHKTNKNPEKISINPIQYREWGREVGGKPPPPPYQFFLCNFYKRTVYPT